MTRRGSSPRRRCWSIGICRRCRARRRSGAARRVSRRCGAALLPLARRRPADPGAARLSRRQSDAARTDRAGIAALRPPRFPGRGAAARRATISCRCSRMRGATCRPRLRAAMTARYLAAFPGARPRGVRALLRVLAAQRNCKIVGIFTRLWRRDGKPRLSRPYPAGVAAARGGSAPSGAGAARRAGSTATCRRRCAASRRAARA